MAIWPASLPQKPFAGLTEVRQQAFLRSNMDAGASKRRKKFTAAARTIDVPMVFTKAQMATFDTLYITTLAEGALSFDWTDPKDEVSTVSFVFRNPPKMTKAGGEWKGVLNLEILP